MEALLVMLALYKWPLVAGVVAATALSQLGVQLATRDRAMQTMCVAQGAMFGVLLSLGILSTHNISTDSAIPLFGALSFAAVCFILSDWVANRRPASKNTFFAFVFAFLLSMSHLISSMFPMLENHLTQVYFGDLATLGERESIFTIIFSIGTVLILTIFRYRFSAGSFNHAVYGIQNQIRGGFIDRSLFNFLSLATICLSVQYLGFLFTISLLFVPTAVLIFSPRRGLMQHLLVCSIFAALGATSGFLLSLQYTYLPTVPTIVGMVAGLLAAYVAFAWLKRFISEQIQRFVKKQSETVFESIPEGA